MRLVNLFIKLIAILLFLGFCVSCEFISNTHKITVIFSEKSPWETAQGKNVWYLLRWNDPVLGICEKYIPAGSEKTVIEVSKGGMVVLAAYPAGNGTPLGAFVTIDNTDTHEDTEAALTYLRGSAAEVLLRAESFFTGIINGVNAEKLSCTMEGIGDGDSWRVEKNELFWAILQRTLGNESVKPLGLFNISLYAIPEGFWVSDTPLRPGFRVHSTGTIELSGFYQGTFKYLLPSENLMLVIIGQESRGYWYITRVFPDFLIQELEKR
ncbi:MAG: hypothetical protein HQ557_01600 [Bacteroidetes bacterium]|nr:hypothetical protein [Bacteroidota bacterium]